MFVHPQKGLVSFLPIKSTYCNNFDCQLTDVSFNWHSFHIMSKGPSHFTRLHITGSSPGPHQPPRFEAVEIVWRPYLGPVWEAWTNPTPRNIPFLGTVPSINDLRVFYFAETWKETGISWRILKGPKQKMPWSLLTCWIKTWWNIKSISQSI